MGVRFCPACGAAVESTGEPAGSPAGSAPRAGASAPGGQPAGAPAGGAYSGSPAQQGLSDNAAGALAYLLIPAIVFLVIDPFRNSKFVRFHSFQALFFAGAAFCFGLAMSVLSGILGVVGLSFLILPLWMLWPLVSVALFVVWVILLIKASQGQQYRLPVLGDLAARQV
jgi:uncharacterized membrane protein